MGKFNDIFKELRLKFDLTQQEVADKFNVTSAAVSKWEDQTQPDYETLAKIADFFSVTVDYLLTGINKTQITSYLEKCAQNDDLKLFEERKSAGLILNCDESGKNIFDYVLKYNGVKIFKEYFGFLFDGLVAKNLEKYYGNFFKLLIKTQTLYDFENTHPDLKHTLLTLKEDEGYKCGVKEFCITPVLERDSFEFIIKEIEAGNETAKNIVFSGKNYWFAALGGIIEDACALGKYDFADSVLDFVEKCNLRNLEIYKKARESRRGERYFHEEFGGGYLDCRKGRTDKDYRGIVGFGEEQIKTILDFGATEQAARAKKINEIIYGYTHKNQGYCVSVSKLTVRRNQGEESVIAKRARAVFEYLRDKSRVGEYELRASDALNSKKTTDADKVTEVLNSPNGMLWHLFPLFESYEIFEKAKERFLKDSEPQISVVCTLSCLFGKSNLKDLYNSVTLDGFKDDARFFEHAAKYGSGKDEALELLLQNFPEKTEEIKLLLDNGAKVSLDCGQEWANGNKPSGMIKIDDFAAILLKMIVK